MLYFCTILLQNVLTLNKINIKYKCKYNEKFTIIQNIMA